MQAILVSCDCSDHDPIEDWQPPDPRSVDIWINITLGPDQRGGDNFQLRVLTPDKLEQGGAVPEYSIVLETYSWPAVLAALEAVLQQCRGDDWNAVATQLSQHLWWEFADYQP